MILEKFEIFSVVDWKLVCHWYSLSHSPFLLKDGIFTVGRTIKGKKLECVKKILKYLKAIVKLTSSKHTTAQQKKMYDTSTS